MHQIVCWNCEEKYGLLKCENKIDYICQTCSALVGVKGAQPPKASRIRLYTTSPLSPKEGTKAAVPFQDAKPTLEV